MGILDIGKNVFDESRCPECQSMNTYLEGNALICGSCGVHIIPLGYNSFSKVYPEKAPVPDERGLLPFDADKTCEKCGYDDIHTGYYDHKEGYYCGWMHVKCMVNGEHMHRSCRRCGYKWVEAVLKE